MIEPGSMAMPVPVPAPVPAPVHASMPEQAAMAAMSSPQPSSMLGPAFTPMTMPMPIGNVEPVPVPTSVPMPMPLQMVISEPVHVTAPEPLLLSAVAPAASAMPVPAPAAEAPASHICDVKFEARDMFHSKIPGFANKNLEKSEPFTTFVKTLEGLAKKLVAASGIVVAAGLDPAKVFKTHNLLFMFDGAPYVVAEESPADALWATAKEVCITFLFSPVNPNANIARRQLLNAMSTVVYRRKAYRSWMSKHNKEFEAFLRLKETAPIWAKPTHITTTK
ncbi:hypothetical protein GGI20_000510 [Coemansia sp. BCRC 34301]|nr:hypothetical protein GGI20_000510 [Coemansia sp. BCRC 34301]